MTDLSVRKLGGFLLRLPQEQQKQEQEQNARHVRVPLLGVEGAVVPVQGGQGEGLVLVGEHRHRGRANRGAP